MAIGILERLGNSEYWQKPRNRYATIAVVVVLLAGAVGSSAWLTFRSSGSIAAPSETLWMCSNGHQFTLTARQLSGFYANHYGEAVTCPTCGAPAQRAVKCPHCGNVVAPGTERLCPVCKQPLNH